MKIVVLDGYAANPGDLSWNGIASLGDLTVFDRTPIDEIARRIGDADVVYTNKAPITRATMEACPNLRLISVLATGYNIVDIAAAKERGIVVSNVPAYSTCDVAQMTFALLLECCHHVGHHSDTVYGGKWTSCRDFCYWDYPPMSLAGKTMGVVGYGQIGRAVARLAQAFGMEVLVTTRTLHPEEASAHLRFCDISELLAASDVVSLHCPLTEKTQNLINRESIAAMKDGSILINTGRGPLLDEAAVTEALKTGKLAFAAVDVVSREPIDRENPLLDAPNCFITPHISWATYDARKRLMKISEDNLAAFLAGSPQNVVNG